MTGAAGRTPGVDAGRTTAHSHTVLATADSDSFASLRRRPTARAERYAMGKALRHDVPVHTCNYDNLPWLVEHYG